MKAFETTQLVNSIALFLLIGFIPFEGIAQQVTFEKKYDFGHNEAGTDLVQTKDGGYFLVGGQTIAINYTNMLMMKTDDHGNMEWHNIIGSGGSANEGGAWGSQKLVNVGDSVIYIAGRTNVGTSGPADWAYFLSKLNSTGDTVWTRTYNPGTGAEAFLDFCQARSGGFLLAGYSSSYDDGYFVRTDFNGDTLWTKTWRGPYGAADINAVISTKDGGFAATGPTENEYGSPYFDMYLLKMDSLGKEEWLKLYKGHDENVKGSTYGHDLVQMPDSGFVLGGIATEKENYQWESYLLRVNSSGDTLWSFRNGDDALKDESIKSIVTDGKSIAATGFGYASSYYILLLQFSDEGKLNWSRRYGGNETDKAEELISTSDGGYAITGYTNSDCNGCVYFIKTDSMGCVEPGCHITGMDNKSGDKKHSIEVYPNPATDFITISTSNTDLKNAQILITDITGKTLLAKKQNLLDSSGNKLQLDIGNLQQGMYLLRIKVSEEANSKIFKIAIQ